MQSLIIATNLGWFFISNISSKTWFIFNNANWNLIWKLVLKLFTYFFWQLSGYSLEKGSYDKMSFQVLALSHEKIFISDKPSQNRKQTSPLRRPSQFSSYFFFLFRLFHVTASLITFLYILYSSTIWQKQKSREELISVYSRWYVYSLAYFFHV